MNHRWFTADLHFGHERIIELCDRPFQSIGEHNEALISKFNELVEPKDEVWILGDVALGTLSQSLPLVKRLHGRKYLVMGNHDRPWGGHRKPKKHDFYLECGFRGLFDHAYLPIADRHVFLSHLPYAGDSGDEDRYQRMRPRDHGNWLLHGHVHEAWRQRDKQINVGVDVWDFYPVEQSVIEAIIVGGDRI